MKSICLGIFRFVYLTSLCLGLILPVVGHAQTDGEAHAYVLTFQGAVTPILQDYLHDGLEMAEATGAEVVILQLDTPGGSVDVTKRIVQDMLSAPIPIVVYVAPSAAQAGSAGTFITLAGHVAAMAPGSSIGAASPVGASGEDVGETMEAKAKNILSADIENLAARRGDEAVAWAISAVQEAAAATADRALELGVIDFIAADVADLLAQMDKFEVSVQGELVTLNTQDAIIHRLDLNPLQEFLNFITNPSVATILLSLGSIGLIAEIYNPGTFVPGAVGLICLLLGLYALGQLDANFAGLALIGLAMVLLVAEAFTPAFGALAFGGALAFIFGSALLFDAPGLSVPWPTILMLATSMLLFALFVGGKALAAQRRPAYGGEEGIIGKTAQVRSTFDEAGQGTVFLAGERWNAVLKTIDAEPLPQIGDLVEIEDRQGYTLIVRPYK